MKTILKSLLVLLFSLILVACNKSDDKTLLAPTITKLDEHVITWDKDENAVEYELSINGIVYIAFDNIYTFDENGSYEIRVRSIADKSSQYKNSSWSEIFSFELSVVSIDGVVIISKPAIELKFNEDYLIEPTLLPEKTGAFTYQSFDENIATVNNGLVKAVGLGQTIIKVSYSRYQSAYLLVDIKPSIIVNNNNDVEIEEKDIYDLKAQIAPTLAPFDIVTYHSSDTSILFVGPTGIISGIKPGNATVTITTTNGGYLEVSVVVTEVVPAVVTISVNVPNIPYDEFDIYLVGSFNGWSTRDVNYKLVRDLNDPQKFSITVHTFETKSNVEYKYILSTTEGYAWETYLGSQTANRSFYVIGGPSQIIDTVTNWQEFN